MNDHSNPPPIPPPTPYSCPNCGLEMYEPVALCPRCGARIQTAKNPSWLKMLGAILLLLLAMPIGASGACFLVFAGLSVVGDGGSGALMLGLIGLVLAGATWLCIKGVRNLWK
ncbi:MAG TPA: hypothetical protein VF600_09350 [Abditibacteriaceae bacterium]